MKPKLTYTTPDPELPNWNRWTPDEHDACGLAAIVEKNGVPSHRNVQQALDALMHLCHRSGEVDGEGDGCGILTDLPRSLWAERLAEAGYPSTLAEDARFFVAHLFLPVSERPYHRRIIQRIHQIADEHEIDLFIARPAETVLEALGPLGQQEAPDFWQLAGVVRNIAPNQVNRKLFDLQRTIERETVAHIFSCSSESVVYKVRGNADNLRGYCPEIMRPDFTSAITIGHNRYSTNTSTAFERVQPFSLLGHNGEINTIRKLRDEATALAFELVPGASDSQDLNRVLEYFIHEYDMTLMEAMELAFPPIINEIKQLKPSLQDLAMFFRQVWGPFAQGPAGIIARYDDSLVASVDAMGLRPLWLVETGQAYYVSSEKGIAPLVDMVADPKPLAPGEKIAIQVNRGTGARLLHHYTMQYEVQQRAQMHGNHPDEMHRFITCGGPEVGKQSTHESFEVEPGGTEPAFDPKHAGELRSRLIAAYAWDSEDLKLTEAMCQTGNEKISSLGFDGPLAALSHDRQNLADYFKESVAVVTNPAVDREREIEHFSTRVIVGQRPPLGSGATEQEHKRVEMLTPVVLGGHVTVQIQDLKAYRAVARKAGVWLLNDLVEEFGDGHVLTLLAATHPGESIRDALARLTADAITAVRGGTHLIVVADTPALGQIDAERHDIDPHMVISVLDLALRGIARRSGMDWVPNAEPGEGLRRRTGLLLRSGSLRNLHDIAMAIGLGADVVNPYLLLDVAAATTNDDETPPTPAQSLAQVEKIAEAMRKGLEKVISTMGIHELRGYGRLVSSIGLQNEIAACFACENYCGSDTAGLSWEKLEEAAAQRAKIMAGNEPGKPVRTFHFYPLIWKVAGQVAQGRATLEDLGNTIRKLEQEHPVSLRHLLMPKVALQAQANGHSNGNRHTNGNGNGKSSYLVQLPNAARLAATDPGVGRHSYPLAISSMSFGSQSEIAFRAYPEAAKRLNIVCLNGEGGEIKDMLGQYRYWRGQQIASGRFGVNAELANSSDLLEIKIGQGAKPGEGGHLPGMKVSLKVAAARNARPGVDLISPSNNHDIYSIEDLAQIVEELKTINPHARVSVKVPVVPGIGTIAVGIAKSGADIITLSGYDGGTGAARTHALRHVGLPSDLGVVEAHRLLVQAGLRSRVELWADGGVKTGLDVIRMILLGANRCGFGTMAMVAIGCTICRGCQLDTCHVGIATQVEDQHEAQKKGMKRFVPRVFDDAVDNLVAFFQSIGEEVRAWTAALGYRRTQDLVGHSELLVQTAGLERVDLSQLIAPAYHTGGVAPFHDPDVEEAVARYVGVAAVAKRAASAANGQTEAAIIEREPVVEVLEERRRHPIRQTLNVSTRRVTFDVVDRVEQGEATVSHHEDGASCVDRGMGTHLSGTLVRDRFFNTPRKYEQFEGAKLDFGNGAIPGNGFAAFNMPGIDMTVRGGAQDGVGKGAFGGRVAIMKGRNRYGNYVDGSVGKSFAYGAQRGLFLIQGDADARAGIRLSGADIVIGGQIRGSVDDARGNLAPRANIKGFGFEYMTNGRVVVLGDPGPWLCAGMTGGVVYQRIQPDLGLDRSAIQRRIAKGAKVEITGLTAVDKRRVSELLGEYIQALLETGQQEEAASIRDLLHDIDANFIAIQPIGQQVDPSESTE